MKLKVLLCLFLFITSVTQAQEKDKYGRPPLVPGIAELKIGDKIPDILIDKIINNDKRSIRTVDYKDKLLVLDFWDTYCTVCVQSMPKLDSLQRVFGDRIKLLSVTYQPEEMITEFLKTNKYLNNRKIPVRRPTVVEDRVLRSYFRYQTNPHVVWIYKGKVMAITGGEYINSENIQTLLHGKAVDWLLKTEQYDRSKRLIVLDVSEDATESPYYSYSVLTGQATSIPNRGGGSRKVPIDFLQDKVGNITRIAFLNENIMSTIKLLVASTKTDDDMDLYTPAHPARKAIEVKDVSVLEYRSEYGDLAEWNRKNLICYELVKQGMVDRQDMAKYALQDMKLRLGISGRYERRKVKCLVFVKTDKPITDTLAVEKGGTSMLTLTIMRLDMTKQYPPAIDETGLGQNVGLRMEPDDGTIAGLRKEMQRHGLDLIEAEREIEVMVISDK